jgi:hypothetical protein
MPVGAVSHTLTQLYDGRAVEDYRATVRGFSTPMTRAGTAGGPGLDDQAALPGLPVHRDRLGQLRGQLCQHWGWRNLAPIG